MKIKIIRKRFAEWHYAFKVVLITIGWLKRYEQLLFGTYPTKPDGWTIAQFVEQVNNHMPLYAAEIGRAQRNLNGRMAELGFDCLYLPQPELILRRAVRADSTSDFSI